MTGSESARVAIFDYIRTHPGCLTRELLHAFLHNDVRHDLIQMRREGLIETRRTRSDRTDHWTNAHYIKEVKE